MWKDPIVEEARIASAMSRALRLIANCPLDVRLISYGPPNRAFIELAAEFG